VIKVRNLGVVGTALSLRRVSFLSVFQPLTSGGSNHREEPFFFMRISELPAFCCTCQRFTASVEQSGPGHFEAKEEEFNSINIELFPTTNHNWWLFTQHLSREQAAALRITTT
jgi:hypothetical protein